MKTKTKIDLEKYKLPPFNPFEIIGESAIVEEEKDSTSIYVASKYSILNRGVRFGDVIQPAPIEVTKTCDSTETWRIIGHNTTGANGIARIEVTKFLNCRNDFDFRNPIIGDNFIRNMPLFLATAHSSEPVFLTYDVNALVIPPPAQGVFLQGEALAVTVTVRSWRHDGVSEASIPFSWMAIGEKTEYYNP